MDSRRKYLFLVMHKGKKIFPRVSLDQIYMQIDFARLQSSPRDGGRAAGAQEAKINAR